MSTAVSSAALGSSVSPWQPLHAAVSALAGVCDGARTRDGNGFDAGDTVFGHRAAALPVDQWSPYIAAAVRDLLASKYHRQLATYGVDVPALRRIPVRTTDPDVATVQATGRRHARELLRHPRTISPGGTDVDDIFSAAARTATIRYAAGVNPAWPQGALRLVFAYDIDVNADVKALPGATFNGEDRSWTVPLTPRNATRVAATLAEHLFDIPAPVRDLLAAAASAPPIPHVTVAGGTVHIRLDAYDPVIAADIKAILGAMWKDPVWQVPLTEAHRVLTVSSRHHLDLSADAETVLSDTAAQREAAIEASRATAADLVVPGLTPHRRLRPFQLAGIAYAAAKRRTFVGDEVGLGKTVIALSTVAVTNSFPVVVICKAKLKPNWVAEVAKWFPGRTSAVVDGMAPAAIPAADVVIVNYDLLGKAKPKDQQTVTINGKKRKLKGLDRLDRAGCRLDDLIAVHAGALIIDESHLLKESDALRSIAARELARTIRERDGVVLELTGTLQKNKPREVFPQIEVLGHDEAFGGFMGYTKRYCAGHWEKRGAQRVWNAEGSSNELELHERLRALCYLRRTKAEVLPELPALQRHSVMLPMSDQARRTYAKAQADIVTHLAERARTEALATGVDITEANKAAFLARIRAQAAEQLVAVNELRRLSGLGKLEAVHEWIDQFLDADTPLVVYAHHQDVQLALVERYDAPAILGGEHTKTREVEANKRRFLSGQHNLLVCSISAASEGHSLGGRLDAANGYTEVDPDPAAPWGAGCTNIAEVQLPWSPGDEVQIAGRVHGRLNAVQGATLWRLLAEDTIDLAMANLLQRKASLADAVQDGKELPPELQTDILGDLLVGLTAQELGLSTDLFDADALASMEDDQRV